MVPFDESASEAIGKYLWYQRSIYRRQKPSSGIANPFQTELQDKYKNCIMLCNYCDGCLPLKIFSY